MWVTECRVEIKHPMRSPRWRVRLTKNRDARRATEAATAADCGSGLRVLLGERQHLIHLPHGLIVMSYLRSDGERSIRASYGSISFFESRMPLR